MWLFDIYLGMRASWWYLGLTWPHRISCCQIWAMFGLGHVLPDQLRPRSECQRMADLGMVLQDQVTVMLGLCQAMSHTFRWHQTWASCGQAVMLTRFVPGLKTPDLMADLGQVWPEQDVQLLDLCQIWPHLVRFLNSGQVWPGSRILRLDLCLW